MSLVKYEWVMSNMNESCHNYEVIAQLLDIWHDSLIIHATWLNHMWYASFMCRCDMTYLYIAHDSFIRMCDVTHTPVRWLHSYVTRRIHIWHDSFICTCGMTHAYMTWTLIHVYVWHDSCIRDMTRGYVRVTWLSHMSHDSSICYPTHSCLWLHYCDLWICDTSHSYVTYELPPLVCGRQKRSTRSIMLWTKPRSPTPPSPLFPPSQQ